MAGLVSSAVQKALQMRKLPRAPGSETANDGFEDRGPREYFGPRAARRVFGQPAPKKQPVKATAKVPAKATAKATPKAVLEPQVKELPVKATAKTPAKAPAKASDKAPGKVLAKPSAKVPPKAPKSAKAPPSVEYVNYGGRQVRRMLPPSDTPGTTSEAKKRCLNKLDDVRVVPLFSDHRRYLGYIKRKTEWGKLYIHSDEVIADKEAPDFDPKVTFRSGSEDCTDPTALEQGSWIEFELAQEEHNGVTDWGSPIAIEIKEVPRPPGVVLPWEEEEWAASFLRADAEPEEGEIRFVGIVKCPRPSGDGFFVFCQDVFEAMGERDAKISWKSRAPEGLRVGDWIEFSLHGEDLKVEDLDQDTGDYKIRGPEQMFSPLCLRIRKDASIGRPLGIELPWERPGVEAPHPDLIARASEAPCEAASEAVSEALEGAEVPVAKGSVRSGRSQPPVSKTRSAMPPMPKALVTQEATVSKPRLFVPKAPLKAEARPEPPFPNAQPVTRGNYLRLRTQ